MAGLGLDREGEVFLGAGGAIGGAGGLGTEHDTGNGRARVGVAVDREERARGDQREHRGTVELVRDAGHDAVIEATDECGVGGGDAGLFRGGVDGGLNGADARLPGVVFEGPAEALHADAGDGGGDARIGGGGEVGFGAALGKADEADACGVDVVAGDEVIDEAHHIADGVEVERVFVRFGGTVGAQDGVGVIGGALGRCRA